MRVPTSRLRIIRDPEDFPERESARPATPGALLASLREEQNLTIEQLAQRTRIPRTSLLALEQDRYEDLPGPVFVKGFLRCCARTLEVDAEAFFELLYAQDEAETEAESAEAATVPELAPPVEDADVLLLADELEPVEQAAPNNEQGKKPEAQPSLLAEMWGRVVPVISQLPIRLPSRHLLWIAVVALLALLVLAAFALGMSGEGVFAPAS